MLTTSLRKWGELTQVEKEDIITRMFSIQDTNKRDVLRKTLASQYEISEGSITSFIAHETMRRNKIDWNKLSGSNGSNIDSHIPVLKEYRNDATKPIKNSIRARVYAITSISELSWEIRVSIISDFSDVIQNSTWNMRYDFYEDMEAISDYYNISPDVVESFVRNTYKWIWIRLDDLKKWKPLTEEEKMSIRRYVAEWEDEKDKKQRRKEMARKHDVSTHVIWAITAWKLWENGEKILGKDSIWSAQFFQNTPSVSWENLPIPWESLKESEVWDVITSEQSIEDKIGEEDSLISIPSNILSDEDRIFIREFASEYNLQDDSQRSDFLQSIFDLFPDATIQEIKEILPNFPDDQIHTNPKRSWEWMWALVNYNNEIKNKWRQKLKDFINENTEKEKRKNMKVLCLPGVECLEIPLYIELWFTPENIIGVEAGIVKGKIDRDLLSQFQQNASRFGIQTRLWKLEKVLMSENTVFDVVSLDFLGPISPITSDIIQLIKTQKRSLLLTNFLGRRESQRIQDFYHQMLQSNWTNLNDMRNSPSLVYFLSTQRWPSFPRSWRQLRINEILKKEAEHVRNKYNSDVNREAIDYKQMRYVDQEKVMYLVKIHNLLESLLWFFRWRLVREWNLGQNYKSWNTYASFYEEMIASLVYLFEYLLVLYGMMPVIISNTRYSYIDSSPMISDFLVLDALDEKKIAESRYLLIFLMNLLVQEKNQFSLYIRNGRNIKVQCSDSIGYKDKLILGKGDNVICEIPVKKIKNEVMQLKRMFDKQKHNIQNNRHLI